MERAVTVTLPRPLYDLAQHLVDAGLFSDFEDLMKTGLRTVLLEWAAVGVEAEPPAPVGPERYRFYLNKLRREIAATGGLFPGKTDQEVIDTLRQTREQIYDEKYAAHLGLRESSHIPRVEGQAVYHL